MRCKNIIIVFVCICFFGSLMKLSYASTSPTRTYLIHLDNGSGNVFEWDLTAPIYASSGSPMTLIWRFNLLAGSLNIAMRMDMRANLDNGGIQQIYYNTLLEGSHSAGYQAMVTIVVTVPSNAMLGSGLNISIYTDLNRWFLFPTEIRDMNYDDLQSAYINAQSQVNSSNQQVSNLNQHIDSLNQQVSNLTRQISNWTPEKNQLTQQVANLTSDKNSLSQQVTSLNSQAADLTSQVSNLKNQSMILTTIIPLVASSIAVVAIAVAAYMSYSKRKLRRNLRARYPETFRGKKI